MGCGQKPYVHEVPMLVNSDEFGQITDHKCHRARTRWGDCEQSKLNEKSLEFN